MDIFDVLDISLREDSYTSLVACALGHADVLAATTARLLDCDRGAISEAGPVHFRRELPDNDRPVKPDLWWDATVNDKPARLILEFKVKAGEHGDQLRLCREEGKKKMDRVGLFFVTLDGKLASDEGWKALRHVELADIIESVSAVPPAEQPVWGGAWQAYRSRLDHYKQHCEPTDTEAVLPWLRKERDGFITTADRIATLAKWIIPEGWRGRGQVHQGAGGRRLIISFYPTSWVSQPYSDDQPSIANNYNVLLELVFPAKSRPSLQLHYVTHPYIPQRKWEAIEGHQEHRARKDRFVIKPTCDDWKATRHPNCKAKSLLSITDETTVAELCDLVAQRTNAIKHCVDVALRSAEHA